MEALNLDAMVPVKQEVKDKVTAVQWKKAEEFPYEAATDLADNTSKSKKDKKRILKNPYDSKKAPKKFPPEEEFSQFYLIPRKIW